jgi:hypothetical protein
MGYVDVGIFLAVMDIGPGILELRIRPMFLRPMFGIQNLQVVPDPTTVVCPARKIGQIGIEIRRVARPSSYFWTNQRSDLLATLAAAGFRILMEEQKMSYRSANRTLWALLKRPAE